MKQFRTLAILGVVLGIPTTSLAADPVVRTEPISGQVVSVRRGEDIVFSQNKTPENIVVKQDLKAGDVLRTNNKGALSIVFADHTQIRLARNTTLEVKQIAQGSPSAIHISKGNVWARSRLDLWTSQRTDKYHRCMVIRL